MLLLLLLQALPVASMRVERMQSTTRREILANAETTTRRASLATAETTTRRAALATAAACSTSYVLLVCARVRAASSSRSTAAPPG